MPTPIKIDFVSDVSCPWCAIGLKALEQAIERVGDEFDVELHFQPFELNPRMPPEGQDTTEHLVQKYGSSPQQLAQNREAIRARGVELGFTFNARDRVYNTFDAHRLIHLAGTVGRREAMVERLFRAYLTDGATLGDIEVLVRLAGEAGVDAEMAREVLEGNQFSAAVRSDEERARTFGISGVPFFAIDERYGVSGAQPPEALLGALREAWNTRAGAAVTLSTDSSSTGACDDGTCAV